MDDPPGCSAGVERSGELSHTQRPACTELGSGADVENTTRTRGNHRLGCLDVCIDSTESMYVNCITGAAVSSIEYFQVNFFFICEECQHHNHPCVLK